jgi:hypothetical protein
MVHIQPERFWCEGGLPELGARRAKPPLEHGGKRRRMLTLVRSGGRVLGSLVWWQSRRRTTTPDREGYFAYRRTPSRQTSPYSPNGSARSNRHWDLVNAKTSSGGRSGSRLTARKHAKCGRSSLWSSASTTSKSRSLSDFKVIQPTRDPAPIPAASQWAFTWPRYEGDALRQWSPALGTSASWIVDTNLVTVGLSRVSVTEDNPGEAGFYRLQKL